MAISEKVSADSSLWASRKSLRRLDLSGEQGLVSVQIFGSDPRTMAEAARISVDHGAQISDINIPEKAKKVLATTGADGIIMQGEDPGYSVRSDTISQPANNFLHPPWPGFALS